MARYVVLNTVTIVVSKPAPGPRTFYAGEVVHDTSEDFANLKAGGAILLPEDLTLAAAADRYVRAKKNRGQEDFDASSAILAAGVQSVRVLRGDPDALTQANWFIDAVNGKDTNDGATAGTALKTAAELSRRLGASARIYPPVNAAAFYRLWTLTILSNLPTTDPLNIDLVLGQNVAAIIKGGGTLPVEQAGTFTAVTNKNVALGTNARLRLTDSNLPFSTFWTFAATKRVRITSGARQNAVMWIAKDLGSRQAEFSEPTLITSMIMANPYDFSDITQTAVVPVVGDAYAIETLRTVTIGTFKLAAEGTSDFTQFGTPVFVMGELACNVRGEYNGVAFPPQGTIQVQTYSCQFGRVYSSAEGWYSQNDCIRGDSFGGGLLIINDGFMRKSAGLVTKNPDGGTYSRVAIAPGASAVFDLDTQVHAGQVQVAGTCRIGSLSIWDTPSNSILIGGHAFLLGEQALVGNDPQCPGAFAAVGAFGIDSARRLWGTGAAGTGVYVGAGCTLATQSGTAVLMVTGASNFRLAGAATGRAWNETTGLWTAALSCTWAIWGTAIGTGFGGNVAGVGNARNNAMDAKIVAQS